MKDLSLLHLFSYVIGSYSTVTASITVCTMGHVVIIISEISSVHLETLPIMLTRVLIERLLILVNVQP